MGSVKALFRLAVGMIALTGVALFGVINFSEAKTTALTCEGELNLKGNVRPEIAFLELTDYRWWVHLWSESHGNVKAQMDKFDLATYVPVVRKIGDGTLALYLFYGDRERKTVMGGLRFANGELTLRPVEGTLFTGKCRGRYPWPV